MYACSYVFNICHIYVYVCVLHVQAERCRLCSTCKNIKRQLESPGALRARSLSTRAIYTYVKVYPV